ncbi:MAG TPA: hypothetical protein VF273_02470 [Pelobium sp.]
MGKKFIKYYVWCLILLSVNAAAQSRSQSIKINPDLILSAQDRAPYIQDIRTINYVWTLQEKEKALYFASADDFFNDAEASKMESDGANLSTIRRREMVPRSQKASAKSLVKKPVTPKAQRLLGIAKISGKKSDADKLNDALKIPLNAKALKAGKNAASFGAGASEIRQMAFNDIKKENPDLAQKKLAKQQRGKNLIWAGLVLVVLGGIMGFVFGRSAFLIAVAGVVFAGIGYFFRI